MVVVKIIKCQKIYNIQAENIIREMMLNKKADQKSGLIYLCLNIWLTLKNKIMVARISVIPLATVTGILWISIP
jgi:hypothetical protein